MTAIEPREQRWQVDGLELVGLCWGDPCHKPVLALHGWLDNAASFARLAPLLDGYYVVALDLTGHGQSSHRSLDSTYQIWDDLPQLVAVIEQLGWQQFDIVGHSRGAMISALLAAVLAEKVGHLVMLDAMLPDPVAPDAFISQLQRFIEQRATLCQRSTRTVANMTQAIALREAVDLTPEAAALLVERGTRQLPDGTIAWTYDQRLRGASAVKMTGSQRKALAQALTMPVLVILAEDGLIKKYGDVTASARALMPEATIHWLAGGHHFHMEDEVQSIADSIVSFFGG